MYSEAQGAAEPFSSDVRLTNEASRRQADYERALRERLEKERAMQPDHRLDELGREIFRLAILKGHSPAAAARRAMDGTYARRLAARHDLENRLSIELNWIADDCRRLDRRREAIRDVRDLLRTEDFLITPRCCDDYMRITRRATTRDSSSRLRSELRARGKFVTRHGDYLRVLVHGRFLLHVERSPDGFLEAARLTPLRRRRQPQTRSTTQKRTRKGKR
jgi:hypothetical protein